jgi:hypothetical protein
MHKIFKKWWFWVLVVLIIGFIPLYSICALIGTSCERYFLWKILFQELRGIFINAGEVVSHQV